MRRLDRINNLKKIANLTRLFSWYDNLYVTRRVKAYNDVYARWGVDLGAEPGEMRGRPREPFILIGHERSPEVRVAMEWLGAVPVRFTGWAAVYGGERDVPLSDHADFYDLLRAVDRVSPEKIYVAYGFTRKFAEILRGLGYDAEPL